MQLEASSGQWLSRCQVHRLLRLRCDYIGNKMADEEGIPPQPVGGGVESMCMQCAA